MSFFLHLAFRDAINPSTPTIIHPAIAVRAVLVFDELLERDDLCRPWSSSLRLARRVVLAAQVGRGKRGVRPLQEVDVDGICAAIRVCLFVGVVKEECAVVGELHLRVRGRGRDGEDRVVVWLLRCIQRGGRASSVGRRGGRRESELFPFGAISVPVFVASAFDLRLTFACLVGLGTAAPSMS